MHGTTMKILSIYCPIASFWIGLLTVVNMVQWYEKDVPGCAEGRMLRQRLGCFWAPVGL